MDKLDVSAPVEVQEHAEINLESEEPVQVPNVRLPDEAAYVAEPDPTPEPQKVEVTPTVATIGVAWVCPKDKGGCGAQMGANTGKVMMVLSRGMGVIVDCKCGKKLGVSLVDPDAPKIVRPDIQDPRVIAQRARFGLKR